MGIICTTLRGRVIPANILRSNIPKYIPQITKGRVVNVYDGDTITIAGYVKYNPVLYQFQVRLRGIDCPEMRSKDVTEKEIAMKAKTFLHNLVYDKIVDLRDVDIDKYGRLLANIFYNENNLNQMMISERLAVSYDGGTKKTPDDWAKYYMVD